MLVGISEILIYLPNCHSLKDKRSIIQRIKALMRKKYNISIAEIGNKDSWKESKIGISCVSDSRRVIDRVMNKIMNDIDQNSDVQLIDYQITVN